MKKRIVLLATMISTVSVLSACGSENADATKDGLVQDEVDNKENDSEKIDIEDSEADSESEDAENSEDADASDESSESGEALQVVVDNPISDENKAKLEALDTAYSKVNWDIEYQAADGIIVSESIYTCVQDHGAEPYYMVIAYTNLTDQPVNITCQGDIHNVDGTINHVDIDEESLAIWPGNTVAKKIICNLEQPSGDITWNNFVVENSDESTASFSIFTELTQEEGKGYTITPTISSDSDLGHYDYGLGLLLDKNGKILYAMQPAMSNLVAEIDNNESIDGKVADAVYFVNPKTR